MPHAIIRGNNGRRHEVDFGDSPIRVEVHAMITATARSLPDRRSTG